MMESVAMSEHGADTPERVLKFVPKEWPNSYGAQVEEVGQAIVAKIQRAADLSNENCDRAMALAHKLSMQLRAAEDRINQLEAEVELFRDREGCAERCPESIQQEIEEKLIAPRSANATEQSSLLKDAELRQVLKPQRNWLTKPTYQARVLRPPHRPCREAWGLAASRFWKELEEEWLSSETCEHYARRGPVRWVNSVCVPGWRAAVRAQRFASEGNSHPSTTYS